MAKRKIYLAEKSDLVLNCTLTESNGTYTCDTTPAAIYTAYTAGTQVYIKYLGLPIPVLNAVYDQEQYYISAALTTINGTTDELYGRRAYFDGTEWGVDMNDSFIVRGAGSLANIGKYLKATSTGVMWDTPEGGGGSTASALDTEEMLELLADTGLIETPGIEYTEYTEDVNGDYVYDEDLGEYRPYEEGDEGTRYSMSSGLLGYTEDNTDYIIVY